MLTLLACQKENFGLPDDKSFAKEEQDNPVGPMVAPAGIMLEPEVILPLVPTFKGGGRKSRFIHDIDHDGVKDNDDNCLQKFNPSQRDFDCDGVGDTCDQCPYEDDAIDINENGTPDACEGSIAQREPTIWPNESLPLLLEGEEPFNWQAYQQQILSEPHAQDSMYAVVDDEFTYEFTLHPFNNICDYDSLNARALMEINFNVSRASGDQNDQLPPPNGFDQAIALSGINPISTNVEIFAYLFISSEQNMVVLSFTGTETVGQLIADIMFIPSLPIGINNTHPGMLVEKGFYEIYRAIQTTLRNLIPPLLQETSQFIISGHSLGGALTTLAALDFAEYHPIVYTFASPRVGNPTFTMGYNNIPILSNTWRIYNTEDLVPDLPFPFFPFGFINPPVLFYEHVGNPVPFTYHLLGLLPNHIEAYRQVFLEGQAPDNPKGMCETSL